MNLLNEDPNTDEAYLSQTLSHDGGRPSTPNQLQIIFTIKSIRSANFTQEEDKIFILAWLNTRIDVIQGIDQKHI